MRVSSYLVVVVLLLLVASSHALAQESAPSNQAPQVVSSAPAFAGGVAADRHPHPDRDQAQALPEGVELLKRHLVSRTVADGVMVGVKHSGVVWTFKW